MNTKTKMKYTTQQINELEREKRASLQELKLKLDALKLERGELLLQLGDGGDTAKDIEANEKRQEDITLEIESLQSVLTAIPKRRDLARADEVEAKINSILECDQRLIEVAPKVDTAAEAFVLAVREYYTVLEAMNETDLFQFDCRQVNIGALDSIGFFLRKHNLWPWIKTGVFRDAKTIEDNLEKNPSRRQISAKVHAMCDHVKQLRGEGILNPNICQKCYGRLQYADPRSDKRRCVQCGAVER